jgi:5'-nucleotidase
MRRPLLLVCALALACGNGSKAPRQLVILHTNDEHSHLLGAGPEQDDFPPPTTAGTGAIKGGISRRSAVLTAQRAAAAAAGAATLTVSAGDNMMGTLTQIAVTAAPDFRLMGKTYLNYDVTTLGNHEFDYGPGALAGILQAAAASGDPIPAIVSTNIHFSGKVGALDDTSLSALFDDGGNNPSAPIHRTLVVVTSNGLRVGFIGIMGADAAAVAPLKAPTYFSRAAGQTDDNRIASLAQLFDDVQPWVDRLRRDQQVDLVVALSHGGLDPDPARQPFSEDYQIAKSVSGIDVIVSGHSHTQAATTVTNLGSGKKVFVQQAGRFGDNVGIISLTVLGDGTVTVDTAASKLIAVDDTTVPSDAAVNGFISKVMSGLEVPASSTKPSFLGFTLFEALQAAPPSPDPGGVPGKLYFASLGELDFDIDGSTKYQETALHDLVVDSLLYAANEIKPGGVDFSLEGYGDIRVSKVEKSSKAGHPVAFADLFRVLPLGATNATTGPSAGTPGYPLCYVGVFLAELKAAFELTASYSYSGHDDSYVLASGYKFEYDTSRQPFNPNGDPTDKNNGRVTRMYKLSASDLAAGNYDGTYVPVFDANISASISPSGWLMNPLALVRGTASLYLTTFATFAGVHLKDPVTGAPIANNDASQTIMHRADGTEIKEWEALARYVKKQSEANGGKVPSRYDKTVATLPRRATCVGANAVSGNCAH